LAELDRAWLLLSAPVQALASASVSVLAQALASVLASVPVSASAQVVAAVPASLPVSASVPVSAQAQDQASVAVAAVEVALSPVFLFRRILHKFLSLHQGLMLSGMSLPPKHPRNDRLPGSALYALLFRTAHI